MKRDLGILKQKYGSWAVVAKRLGVTPRRIYQILEGDRPSKTLETLIRLYARQIRELEE